MNAATEAAPRRHRRARAPAVGARLRRVERRQHQRPPRRRPHPDDADERVEGVHDARHDGGHRSRRRKIAGERKPSSELKMHLAVYELRPDVTGGGARAPAARDRLRRRRHRARSGGAGRGDLHARQHPDRRLRDAVDRGAAGRGAQLHQGARRAAARQPRRAHGRQRPVATRTTRWRRSSTSRRSAWWRGRSAASACSRATKCTGCRGCAMYGIASPAPICTDAAATAGGGETCQVVQAPRHRRQPCWWRTRRRRR